jgi:hypothetical protein
MQLAMRGTFHELGIAAWGLRSRSRDQSYPALIDAM